MVDLLKQDQYIPYDVIDQCLSIFAASKGFLDDLPLEHVHAFEADLLDYFRGPKKDLRDKLASERSFKPLNEEVEAAMKEFKPSWQPPAN